MRELSSLHPNCTLSTTGMPHLGEPGLEHVRVQEPAQKWIPLIYCVRKAWQQTLTLCKNQGLGAHSMLWLKDLKAIFLRLA